MGARDDARRTTESRYRLLADSARDVVWTIAPDGRITYVSPAVEALRGYTPEEAMALPLERIHPPESAAKSAGYFVDMLTAIRQGRRPEPFRGDLEYYRKDGTTFWTEVLAFPVLDENGQLVELLGVTRDLRDRRALEEEHRQVERMEAMGRLAAGVAHQMNNVLAVIRSAVEPFEEDAAGSDEAEQRRMMVLRSVDRAAALTAQLLSFSQRQHLTPTRQRLGELMSGARVLMERVAAPGSALQLLLPDDAADAVLEADHTSFEQLLLHLIANARDAMPRGGTIRVRCATTELRGPLATQHTGRIPPGAYVTIAVEDDGVGMDTDVLAQLFQPFFTTKPMDKGTGLGLPTVFGILKQHGAGVTVESEAGKGSRFTVFWPMHGRAAAAPVVASPRAVAPERAATRARPRVLLVDDEPFLLALTRKAVERLGCDTLTAASGRAALALARANVGTIDLLLTDVRMPEMTGTELVQVLIEQGIDLPTLFVSGQLDAPIPTDWPATVPRRFLGKPFKLEQLVEVMTEMGVLAPAAQG